MSSENPKPSPPSEPPPVWLPPPPPPSWTQRWSRRTLWIVLVISVLFNIALFTAYGEYYASANPPLERYHSGDRTASDKIAVLKIHGTIMPPFTERLLKMIDRAAKDDAVKAILLDIDSPGGLVADSHQIYHKLRELNATKPIAVSMKRMAASGGYYVAMGSGVEGRIFAEPTTWTGSIGVIIPRFNLTQLADKVGVVSEPLKTGPLKDALSPFRDLSEEERAVWNAILEDSFQRFQSVILEGRKGLDASKVKSVATGQIFTAEQAKTNGLIDEIGFEADAINWLKEKAGLKSARVITYQNPLTLFEMALGVSTAARPASEMEALLDASVPRAYYHCSWAPAIGPTTLE